MTIKLDAEKSLSESATSGRDFLLHKTRRVEKVSLVMGEQEDGDPKTVELTIEALPTKVLTNLIDSHPPRKNNNADQSTGFNRDSFPPALFEASVKEPKLSTDEWDDVWHDDAWSAGEHAHLLDLVFGVSNKGFNVPFGGRS